MQTTITKLCYSVFQVSAVLVVFLGLVFVPHAEAATTVGTYELPRDVYMTLKAKVEYLTELVSELTAGDDAVPDPTFAIALRGNVAQINGTIARTPSMLMETCGPMVKGTVDWGDGTKESLYGLGCSGDVFTFERYHVYAVLGTYKITVTGEARTSKTIAPGSARNDTSGMLTVTEADGAYTAAGAITLDKPLTDDCEAARIATLDWGDGSAEYIMSDDCGTTYETTHTYAMPGTYTILLRDQDGDAVATQVVIE